MADQPKQTFSLQSAPGLQDYFKEKADIDQNTARLRALRLEKEAAEQKAAAALTASKPPAKRAVRKKK